MLRRVLHFVPWGSDGLSLDLMRRDRSGPARPERLPDRGDHQAAPDLGVKRISLNFAVFRAALERGERIGAGPVLRAWRVNSAVFCRGGSRSSRCTSSTRSSPGLGAAVLRLHRPRGRPPDRRWPRWRPRPSWSGPRWRSRRLARRLGLGRVRRGCGGPSGDGDGRSLGPARLGPAALGSVCMSSSAAWHPVAGPSAGWAAQRAALPGHGRRQRHAGFVLRRRGVAEPGTRSRTAWTWPPRARTSSTSAGSPPGPARSVSRPARRNAPGRPGHHRAGRGRGAGQRGHHAGGRGRARARGRGPAGQRRQRRPGRPATCPGWWPRPAVPYVVMHWRGHSRDMNDRATYDDVVREVRDELRQRRGRGRRRRASTRRSIIVDPGSGFAKLQRAQLGAAGRAGRDRPPRLGCRRSRPFPVLVGASRKSFLGTAAGRAGRQPRPSPGATTPRWP